MWLVNVVDLCPGLLTMYCFAYQSISCTASDDQLFNAIGTTIELGLNSETTRAVCWS